MTAEKAIAIAAYHFSSRSATIVMASSARLCLEDARELLQQGREDEAKRRALDSLRYSVGILHPDYQGLLARLVA